MQQNPKAQTQTQIQDQNQNQNLDEHYSSFLDLQKQIRDGPVTRRTVTDNFCLIVLLVLLLAFIAIGVYYLVAASNTLRGQYNNIKLSGPLTIIKNVVVSYWPVFVGAYSLALLLSAMYFVLLQVAPKFMVYTVIVLGMLTQVALVVISAIHGAIYQVITGSLTILGFIALLCCYQDQIQQFVILLRVSLRFLRARCEVILVPVICTVLILAFLVYWIVTLLCIQHQASQAESNLLSTAKEVLFYVLWIVVLVLTAFFMYYTMVFIIGYSCAHWFYGKQESACCKGFFIMARYHAGSLTLASFLLTIVCFLQILTSFIETAQKGQRNSCQACCLSMVSCCVQFTGSILKTLNLYSIITQSVTGQSYVQSAKAAAGLLFRDLPLMAITNSFLTVFSYTGVIFAAGVPTLVAYLIVWQVYFESLAVNVYEMTALLLLVMGISVIISLYLTSAVSVAVASVFVFFGMEKRYREIGVTIPGAPAQLKDFDPQSQLQADQQQPANPQTLQLIC